MVKEKLDLKSFADKLVYLTEVCVYRLRFEDRMALLPLIFADRSFRELSMSFDGYDAENKPMIRIEVHFALPLPKKR